MVNFLAKERVYLFMGNASKTGKVFFLLFVVFAASSTIVFQFSSAQSIPKPSVPQFTLSYADHSYYLPPTYGIDQYTGKSVVTSGGYYVENKTIDVSIKNQHFTSFTESSGNQINLYYNIRVKGHFGGESDWKELYSPYSQRNREGTYYTGEISPTQSVSQYTIISLSASYPSESQIDIQVQTLEGYFTQYYPYTGFSGYGWRFTGEMSNWSNTQTITIPVSSASPNPSSSTNPTLAPSSPSTPGIESNSITLPLSIFIIIVAVLVAAVVSVLLLLASRLHRKKLLL
jgi:hypothetical protein